ncbi:transposase [Cryobacterium sp. Y29]|uniref:transposase n=1 Tax=Cryobacterium sp. Y29 TaxID=2048285 RepID=UPI0011B07667
MRKSSRCSQHRPRSRSAFSDSDVRSGTGTKVVISPTTGLVIIQVPRDRDGTFTPVMVPKRRRIFLTVCVVGEDEWTARERANPRCTDLAVWPSSNSSCF